MLFLVCCSRGKEFIRQKIESKCHSSVEEEFTVGEKKKNYTKTKSIFGSSGNYSRKKCAADGQMENKFVDML